jgi:peptidoglycan/LPS O-acetylase OafA/YrhL
MSEPSRQTYTFSHRPDIQGLRGIAVILVILYHAHVTTVSGGYVGVDVFFVISGFVIAAGIFRELERRDGKFSFRSFYERRMRRLLPSLSVAVLLTLVSGFFLAPYSSLRFLRRTGLAATFFNANHYLFKGVEYFAPAAERNALLHTWSLSVEEQFYFVFPLLFVLAATFALRGKKPFYRTIGALMGVVFALSLAAELYFSYAETSILGLDMKRAAFFGAPLRAWEFGVGVLLATALPWLQSIKALTWRTPMIVVGVVMITMSAVLYDESTLFPGVAAFLPVLGTALMLVAGSLKSDTPSPGVSHRLLTRVGDLSYGWYLWHWPPLVFVAATWPGDPFIPMLCTLIISLGLAWLNERLVETPIRHAAWVKKKYASLVILALCFGLPIAGYGFQELMLRQLNTDPSIVQLNKLEDEYNAIGCNTKAYSAAQTSCRWGTQGAPWRVVLVGDSNARQFIPVLREVVPALGGEFHAATFNRCLFSDLRPISEGSEYKTCTTWMTETMAELEKHPPDVVLISASYDNYLSEKIWAFGEPNAGAVHHDRAARTSALQRSSERLSKRLVDAGSQVAFIKTIPKFKGYEAFEQGISDRSVTFGADCSLFKMWYFPDDCGAQRQLEQGESPRWIEANYGREAYRTSLGEGVGEIIVDDTICPGNVCLSKREGTWIYRDTGHLNPHGARQTRPAFERFLVPLKPAR